MSRAPVHRGWRVEGHAVDQFVKRVLGRAAIGADLTQAEVATWLREHAHQATHTGEVTRKGNPVYRLAHPWPGPDAALIVKHDPGGVIAAVTCAWWEELDELDAPAPRLPKPAPEVMHRRAPAPTMMAVPDRPLSAEEIRAGLARAVRRGSTPKAQPTKPKPHPAPQSIDVQPSLACPPGGTSLDFLRPGLTLDLAALPYEQMRAWVNWLGPTATELVNRGLTARHLAAVALRKRLKAMAHEVLMRAAPPLPKVPPERVLDRETYDRALIAALGAVLREEMGEVESSRLFSMAKARARAEQETEAAE